MFLKTKKLLHLTVILLNSVETFAFTPSIPTLEQKTTEKRGMIYSRRYELFFITILLKSRISRWWLCCTFNKFWVKGRLTMKYIKALQKTNLLYIIYGEVLGVKDEIWYVSVLQSLAPITKSEQNILEDSQSWSYIV